MFSLAATSGRVPKMFHSGCRQRRVEADAANPHVAPRAQHRADGQEHDDAQGHPWPPREQPSAREATTAHQGQCGLRLYSWRPC